MPIRDKPTYLSYEVWRALWLLAKAERGDADQIVTPDEIADDILRQAIREQHPQLMQHQKRIDDLENSLIETLRQNRFGKLVHEH